MGERPYLDSKFVLAVMKSIKFKRDYENAKNDMEMLENALMHSFDEAQLQIYEEFCKKREEFFEAAYKYFLENDCPRIRVD